MYSLEFLIETFTKHIKESKKINEDLLRQFTIDYPGEEIPEYLTDDFSLAKALLSICKHLKYLKDEMIVDDNGFVIPKSFPCSCGYVCCDCLGISDKDFE